MRQRFFAGTLLLLCLSVCSCSKTEELNPVQGKVMYQNKPLSGATVTFHPKDNKDLKAIPPTGFTAEDGTFTLTTGDKNGAIAGDYIVTIICSEVANKDSKVISTGGQETEDRLKGAYASRDNSKITIQIKAGPNQLEPFDLK